MFLKLKCCRLSTAKSSVDFSQDLAQAAVAQNSKIRLLEQRRSNRQGSGCEAEIVPKNSRAQSRRATRHRLELERLLFAGFEREKLSCMVFPAVGRAWSWAGRVGNMRKREREVIQGSILTECERCPCG